MSERCEVCGCVTEEEMLKSCQLGSAEVKVCSFCKKQLDSIEKNPKENYENALNLLNMDTSGRRSEKVQKALREKLEGLGISEESQPADGGEGASAKELEELREKVDSLESELKAFKKRYVMTKILEVVIPIAFIVIMLIVIVASGALKNIFNYYETIMEYANM